MITAILTGYQRIDNLLRLLDAVEQQTVPVQHIWIWHTHAGDNFVLPRERCGRAGVTINYYDHKYHSRFAFALCARTEYVAMLDDDTIPGNRWFETALNACRQTNGLIGSCGRILTDPYNNVDQNFFDVITDKPIEVDYLVGTYFFRREHLNYYWYEEPVDWLHGEDFHLSHNLKKFGGIKTYVAPKTHDRQTWGNQISTSGDEFASCRKPAHAQGRINMMREYLKKGWKSCRSS